MRIADCMKRPVVSSNRMRSNSLRRASNFALELGRDALVAAKPRGQLLFLSHDDRLEIYRGFDGRVLARQLTGLGYWHR